MQDLWQVQYEILSIIYQKGIHKIKCKDCDCFPRYESVKGNSIKHEAHLATRTVAVDPWHLKVEVAD